VVEVLVRTTQWMTQSVLALRAFLGRKNRDHLHTVKEERRERRMQLMCQMRAKIIYCLGARDTKELSDAWVCVQPC
jgi:hypothetical protein